MSYTNLYLKTFSFELIYYFKMWFLNCLCLVLEKKHSAKSSLSSVKNKTLGKELLRRVFSFTECPKKNTRQRTWHSAKSQIPVVMKLFGTRLAGLIILALSIDYSLVLELCM
jgi:hypothetical protein